VAILAGLINRGLNLLLGALCLPFQKMDPMWALAWVSLLAGVLMVWIFGKVSNQKSIEAIKEKIRGNLIGVRLFQDDMGVVFRLQGRVLLDALIYMKYALVPMLILMVPVVLIMIQLNLRFSVRPLQPGESAIVKVKTAPEADLKSIVLTAPEGVSVETPPVKIASENEVAWRVRPDREGAFELAFETGNNTLVKRLDVGPGWGAISAARTGRGLFDMLLWPGEAPIESNQAIRAIEVDYPPLPLTFLGWNMNWLVVFFVLSIVFGFAFKDLLGVKL